MNATVAWNETGPWTEGDILTWRITEVLLLPVFFLVGVVGNGLVFYVNHFRLPSNTDTLFKRILAAIDLIDLSLSLPMLLFTVVAPESPAFVPCCRCLSFVALWSALLAGEVLAVISVDRFLKLCLLRKSGLEPPQIKKILLGLIVFTSAAILPTIWLYTKNTIYYIYYDIAVSFCFMDFETRLWYLLIAFSVNLSVCFVAILAVLVVMYIRIILKLRELSAKHSQLKGPTGGDHPSSAEAGKANRQSDAMRKSSLVFIAVTAAFFGCYTPYFVSVLLQATSIVVESNLAPATKAVLDLAKLSPLVSHMINPLIYLISSDQLGKEVKDIILCKNSFRDCLKRRAALPSGNQRL
ncbi:olfactory receptor 24 [Biomphalaria glabrata]|nr:olfactory receptor 24-like; partial [Biomphalaria glabrata]